jgi:hypothetical protein
LQSYATVCFAKDGHAGVDTFTHAQGQNLKINDLEYFKTQVLNVLVYSNLFIGGFNDESTELNDHEIIVI